ncbi:MAG: iron-containing redox enzyme family protein [Actinomycetota bacterium]|nr:iron-containing redox enzyme family protein [Actinomycetota bacterium]
MLLPTPRGPLSAKLFVALHANDPQGLPYAHQVPLIPDAVGDDDLQLCLWTCYELHYLGFDDVSDDWEWQPELIAFRAALENRMLDGLRRDVKVPWNEGTSIADQLWTLVGEDAGKSPARYLQRQATIAQFREYMMHRSIYQLKEADPHTWGIPRLSGRPKAALVEIQMDEYGNGELARMHSHLFTRVLRFLDIADGYGAHIESAPGITLALSNVISMFGLHRALRGSLVGHLAAFEMNSSDPSRRISRGLRRIGADDGACRFYDVHITADSLHEQTAVYDLCGSLVESEPELGEDILFGAAVSLHLEARFAEHVLGRWSLGESSLRHERPRALLAG